MKWDPGLIIVAFIVYSALMTGVTFATISMVGFTMAVYALIADHIFRCFLLARWVRRIRIANPEDLWCKIFEPFILVFAVILYWLRPEIVFCAGVLMVVGIIHCCKYVYEESDGIF